MLQERTSERFVLLARDKYVTRESKFQILANEELRNLSIHLRLSGARECVLLFDDRHESVLILVAWIGLILTT